MRKRKKERESENIISKVSMYMKLCTFTILPWEVEKKESGRELGDRLSEKNA